MMNETDEEEDEEEVQLESGKGTPQTFQSLKGASSALVFVLTTNS